MKTALDTSGKSLTLTSLLTDFKEITKAGLAISVVFSSIVGYLLGVSADFPFSWMTFISLVIG